ncbi:hypothetical protein [Nocardia sp. IFM 10818]
MSNFQFNGVSATKLAIHLTAAVTMAAAMAGVPAATANAGWPPPTGCAVEDHSYADLDGRKAKCSSGVGSARVHITCKQFHAPGLYYGKAGSWASIGNYSYATCDRIDDWVVGARGEWMDADGRTGYF